MEDLNLPEKNQFTNIISPPQITSNLNNYNPTGFEHAGLVNLDFDSGPPRHSITGLKAPNPKRYVKKRITNESAFEYQYTNNDASSLADNRILTFNNATLFVVQNQYVDIHYDPTINRWVVN